MYYDYLEVYRKVYKIRNYSEVTIEQYISQVRKFFDFYPKIKIEDLEGKHLEDY